MLVIFSGSDIDLIVDMFGHKTSILLFIWFWWKIFCIYSLFCQTNGSNHIFNGLGSIERCIQYVGNRLVENILSDIILYEVMRQSIAKFHNISSEQTIIQIKYSFISWSYDLHSMHNPLMTKVGHQMLKIC